MKSFKELNIEEDLIKKLRKIGIDKPTKVQQETIPLILENKDVIVQADTGTGKTFAFILPILQSLQIEIDKKNPQILIIVPTRELVIQIEEEFNKLNFKNNKILGIYGGKGISGQIEKLTNGVDIVVATTGRLIDILEKNAINLSKIKTLVIDEVDQILLMGFKNDVEDIICRCNKNRQTLCFSATIDKNVNKIIYKISKNPIRIIMEKNIEKYNILQYYINTTEHTKLDTLATLLNDINPFMGIIFCRTKIRVDKLEDKLIMKGFSCQKLHSDVSQSKREKIMKSFKNLEFQFLIATDVASRGIDINGITHIFNYDIPEDEENYIHRIGRTGRALNKGASFSLITDKNLAMLEKIQEKLKFSIKEYKIKPIINIISKIELPKLKYNKKINTKQNWKKIK